MGWLRTTVGAAVSWTLVMLGAAVLLAGQAISTLYHAQQACYFGFPAVACPAGDDPAVVHLTFAFFGMPLIWLAGMGVVGLAWVRRRRGSSPHRGRQ